MELARQKYSGQLDFVRALRRAFAKNHIRPQSKAKLIVTYKDLIKKGELKENKNLARLLVKRAIRTLSGVSVITLLSKPYGCPGNCVYCPLENGMPKSYLSNEPAAQRAKMLAFDPVSQINTRIQTLLNNGHPVDKLEILILGGTWSHYPKKYQQEFVRDVFYAANTFGKKNRRKKYSLIREQKINERAKYKIIGLTLETRPDFVTEAEIKNLRSLGCTRVQIGVQHTDNQILKKIKRGHSLEQSIKATKLLKEAGFKVDHHYMPDLPGSTPAKDLKMFKYIFSSPDLQPDQIKIYPCVVNEHSQLYKWYKTKKYKPFSAKQLLGLLLKVKQLVPPWIRINRLIRDIPKESIVAGNKITNLRQLLQIELKKQNKTCQCLRCREVRSESKDIDKALLVKREYRASGGREIFLSFESGDKKKIYAFLRLRFNKNPKKNIFPELKDSALIRELHVYGQMIPVSGEYQTAGGDDKISQTQHLGLGKKLMAEAEKISQARGLKKIVVISGIGVRNYYRKLGYRLKNTYMIKNID